MAWLNIPPKKKNSSRRITTNRKARNEIYQTNKWKILRDNYIKKNPCCECCKVLGKTTAATDIHHKVSFLTENGDKRYELAFDWDNLMSLCREHHNFLHKKGATHGFDEEKFKEEWNKKK